MKTCPVCRELVQDEAKKCPHCWAWLELKEHYFKSFDYLLWKDIKSIKEMMVYFTTLSIIIIFGAILVLAVTFG